MNWKLMMVVCMVVGLLVMGCSSSNAPPTGYYSYEGQGAQQQGAQYAGGGCGLAGVNGDAMGISSVAASA